MYIIPRRDSTLIRGHGRGVHTTKQEVETIFGDEWRVGRVRFAEDVVFGHGWDGESRPLESLVC